MIFKNPKFKGAALAIIFSAIVIFTAACAGGTGDGTGTSASDDPFFVDTVAPPENADTSEDTTEVNAAPVEPYEPELINPLTGLESFVDFENRRPLAIMINNIKAATPQEGISFADIMYECIVEGWQTRLMMVVSDYENLPVVGSVRSSREYYLDFAANHNAIYMHAGGSKQAYKEIKARAVNNLDGVNDNAVSSRAFYRDSWRMNNMGYEHSLMTSGAGIADALEYKKYDTTLIENFDSPLDFVPYGTGRVPEGGSASYIKVKYSGSHQPYFEYNAEEGVYYRWQFLGDRHMDNTANVQLSFTNVIVLYCPTKNTGDSYGHVDVITTGEGEGYYLTRGKYEKIRWVKSDEDTPVKLYNEAGEELLINRGKTFFQICTSEMKDTTEIR